MNTLNELNDRLAGIGMPRLDGAGANKLKQFASRERVVDAICRVEIHNDTGAYKFLDKTFTEAGLHPASGSAGSQGQGAAQDQGADPTPTQAPQQQSAAPAPESTGNGRAPGPHPNAPNGDAPDPPERQSSRPAPESRSQDRIQHHIYGSKASLMFELDETPAGKTTVALDGAYVAGNNSNGNRTFDWSNKVRVQFTPDELPVVAAVLFGISGQCEYFNHGPENDKGFGLEWQGDRGGFFIRVWQGKNNQRAVPMGREDAWHAGQVVLRALQQASPAYLDAAGAMAMLRAMFGRT